MEAGTRLGPYEILEPLGAGGMGEVYLALDTRLNRQVALKLLPDDLASDPERLSRLRREAQMLAALNHPGIASIHNIEELGDNRFLVLELVAGETLAEHLARGPMPLDRALDVSLQVAAALEVAHDRGIIHRDLKPSNIKLTPEGRVKLLDFGLAKPIDSTESASGLSHTPTAIDSTATGTVLGTVAYMSPEQARGRTLDKRADIWSYGCVLFELLAGRRAFDGDSVPDVLAAIVKEQPVWGLLPSSTPPRVRTLVRRCLNKKADLRLRDIGDARLELSDALDEPTPPAEAVVRPPWRRALPWALATALAVGWAIAELWPGSEPAPAEPMRVEMRIARDQLVAQVGAGLSVSPDGRVMAYAIRPGAFTEVNVRRLDSLQGVVVASGAGPDAPYNPFFSPDGTKVGYVTSSELRHVPVGGGPATMLCRVFRSRGASWGELGSIAVAPGTDTGLFRIDASGGALEQLTALAEGERSHRWPHFLPGETALIFVVWRGDPTGNPLTSIEAFEPSTGRRVRLVDGGTFPTYSRSGHLLYVDGNTLMAAPFDIDRLALEGEAVPVVRGVHANQNEGGAQYTLSSTGTLVYRSDATLLPKYPALLVDRAGTSTPFLVQPETYGSPEFSPDGDRIAMTRYQEGNWDVWIQEVDGGSSTRLTFDPGADVAPIWAHDGEQIYFASQRAGAVYNIWRRAADGSGEPELVRPSPYTELPSDVSPDGRHLMIYQKRQRGGFKALLSVDLSDTGRATVFEAPERGADRAVFSPNGRWVAYSSGESRREEIYVRPFPDGGGKWQISQTGGGHPHWSAEGTELFFRDNAGVQVAGVVTDGSVFRHDQPRPLFNGDYMGGYSGLQQGIEGSGGDYAVAPDGQAFIMFPDLGTVAGGSEFVTLVLNWFEELGVLLPARQ